MIVASIKLLSSVYLIETLVNLRELKLVSMRARHQRPVRRHSRLDTWRSLKLKGLI